MTEATNELVIPPGPLAVAVTAPFKVVAKKPPAKKPAPKAAPAPAKIPGIIYRVADTLVIRYTPLGRGRWRCEDQAAQTTYEEGGGAVGAHDGTYIEIAAFYFNQFDHFPYVTDPFVPPKLVKDDA